MIIADRDWIGVSDMREILFKAKRKDNGEWVEGNLITNERNENQKYIGYIFDERNGVIEDFDLVEVIPTTICQYTGLTDKNGKRIWENDILRGHNNDDDLARVVFGEFNVIDVYTLETVDKVVGWHTEVIETDALSKCEPFCLPMPLTDLYIKRSEFEVFGNIFDNPELLEV